jgi:UDP-3-O-[3-hydroxymyristoyl] glucosamine N-acyltransferase
MNETGPAGLTLSELAALVGGEVEGDPGTRVASVSGVDEARADSLVRVDQERYLEAALRGPGAALLVARELPVSGKPALRVANPRLAFAICMEALAPPEPLPPPGIHASAVLGEDVRLEEGVAIGAGAVIGRGCRLGAAAVIGPNVTLGEGVVVGPHCVLFPNVVLYPGVELGARVRIQSGAVLGGDGFGYVWDGERFRKIPHRGSVRIGDDVEIGANVAIDRAATGATEIGPGTKIDNLVQLGHNVKVGPHCLIVAQVGVAGSAEIGAHVVLGGQVGVRDHIRIGDGAQVAGKAGVWNDLPGGGPYAGHPARPRFQEERTVVALLRLPELARRVKQLEREVAALKQQLAAAGAVDPGESPADDQPA